MNDAAVSQLYLEGKGNRSYFDARAIYYLGFSESDTQSQIPVIHPVIDYNYVFDRPILGGELGYRLNFTSLTRNQADFDPITQSALNNGTLHANRQSRDQDNRQLPAARRSRHLQPFLGRGTMAAQHHRRLRPGIHALCFGARRRRCDADQ